MSRLRLMTSLASPIRKTKFFNLVNLLLLVQARMSLSVPRIQYQPVGNTTFIISQGLLGRLL